MMARMRRICWPHAGMVAIGLRFGLPILVGGVFYVRMGMSIDRLGKVHPAPQDRDDHEQAHEFGHGGTITDETAFASMQPGRSQKEQTLVDRVADRDRGEGHARNGRDEALQVCPDRG
jgi:hypothetical protein